MTDINGTSGIQTQAYSTSVLATLRKGVTKLEVAGYSPSAYVLRPTDWEGVELALSSTNSIEHQGLPYDPATRRLFGVPVTTSNAAAADVAAQLAASAHDTLDPRRAGVEFLAAGRLHRPGQHRGTPNLIRSVCRVFGRDQQCVVGEQAKAEVDEPVGGRYRDIA